MLSKDFGFENPHSQYLKVAFKLSSNIIESKITRNQTGHLVEKRIRDYSD